MKNPRGGIVNAVPSLAEVHPQASDKAPIADDLVGSGLEIRDAQPARLAIKRLRNGHPSPAAGNAAWAIRVARNELRRRDPHLGAALAMAFPRACRDDSVGTMIRSGNTIRFNRAYVLSLNREQLVDHMWQLAVSLQTRF